MPASVKQHQQRIWNVAKGTVANGGSDNSPLFLFSSGSGSAAIKFTQQRRREHRILQYKVAVAQLWIRRSTRRKV